MLLRFLFLYCFIAISWADDPVVIALDADVSAVAKAGGIAIQRGATIAIQEINDAGGVLGRPFKLQTFDHRGNPARGISNIKKIAKTDGVVAILGGVHTPVALQELPFIHEYQLIYLSPWAAGTTIVDNGYDPNFVFRVSVRDAEAGKVLIKAAKDAGVSRVALLLEQTGWGRSNQKSMGAAAKEAGLQVVATEWFNWKQESMASELEKIARSGAEGILLVANAPEGSVAIRDLLANMETRNLKVFSHWGIAGGAFVQMLGKEKLAQANLQVLQSYSFLDPHDPARNEQVLKAYSRFFNASVNAQNIVGAVGVAQAYDLVYLLKLAIEKAGTTERMAVRKALENLPNHTGLIKKYAPAFAPERHDALWAADYFMTSYNKDGHLIPTASPKIKANAH